MTGEVRFRNIVEPEAAASFRAEGWWGDDALTDVVRRHAQAQPEATAFVCGQERLSWLGYDRASDHLAAALIGQGLAPGARVAVLLPDGPSVHVAFLANEKAGLTTVGLGSRAGEAEIRHLVERTEAVALVTFEQHRGRSMDELATDLRRTCPTLRHHLTVPRFETGARDISVDGALAEGGIALTRLIDGRRLGPDDLFMVNSTSGTTGLPKCVMHHENRWMYFHQKATEVGQLNPADVFFGAVPAPFGFGLWTAHFTPSLLGAPTILAERFDADEALALIEHEKVTVLCAVSTQFIMMLNSPQLDRRDLSSLRVMFTGGETVPYARAQAFEERTGAVVLQFYGSNESGLATGTRLSDPRERRLRTAGRALSGTELRLYEDGRDVTALGMGQPGTRGPATCVGYLDDRAANAELFTDDGFVLHADLCTIDDEGYLRVVGRKSDIIIRGGKNISAAQVEDSVGMHPAVGLAAAVPMEDDTFGERICAFVELRPGATLELAPLLDFLAQQGVSKELFPERLVVMEELPRASGGKVAKGELRETLRGERSTN